MNNQEYVCIRYLYINDNKYFIPNLVYSFFKKDDYLITLTSFSYYISENIHKKHFILKSHWLREQKINLILNS